MRLSLVAFAGCLLVVVGACSGAGAPSRAPSEVPSTVASAVPGFPSPATGVTRPPFPRVSVPGASGAATAGPTAAAASGGRAVTTSLEAIEAVGVLESQFEGYRPQPPDVIGASSNVLVQEDATGFLVTFVTGSGDCFAGCINTRYDKFHVAFDGTVDRLCTWTIGDEEEGTPC